MLRYVVLACCDRLAGSLGHYITVFVIKMSLPHTTTPGSLETRSFFFNPACYCAGISLALAQTVEEAFDGMTDAELCKLRDVDSWRELQTVLHDTVDTSVHVITDMMDMLSGKYSSTDASMTAFLCFIYIFSMGRRGFMWESYDSFS